MRDRAPDVAGFLTGWRVWRMSVDGELVSAYSPAAWPARSPIVATCYETGDAHAAPDEWCACGVYGCEEPGAALFYAHRSGSPVVGTARLWGRVVEHEAGWRAEKGYPDRLFVPRDVFDRHAGDVAAHLSFRYGVPAHVIDELHYVDVTRASDPVRGVNAPMPRLSEFVERRVRPLPPNGVRSEEWRPWRQ
jgi:hypothetical protein